MPYQGNDSIARLILAHGQAQADARQRSGEAIAGGIASVGQAVSGTMADLVKYRLEAPRRETEQIALEEKKREVKIRQAIDDAWTTSGGDADKAVSSLEAKGHGSAAMALRGQVAGWRKDLLGEQATKIDLMTKRLTMASQLLPAPPTQRDDPAQLAAYHSAYTAALPQLRETIGPELSKFTPEPDDPDLLPKIDTMREWGMTQAQKLETRRAAIELARLGVDQSRDARSAEEHHTKALGQWLSTVDTQQEWDAALTSAKSMGASESVLKKFGPTYSKDAAAKALDLALTPEQLQKKNKPEEEVQGTSDIANYFRVQAALAKEQNGGTPLTAKQRVAILERARLVEKNGHKEVTDAERRALAAAVIDKPAIYKDLTQTMKSAIALDLYGKGFEFPKEANEAREGIAERWRQSEIAKLNDSWRKAQNVDPRVKGISLDAMTPEQRDSERRRIEDSYRVQTGKAPLSEPEWQTLRSTAYPATVKPTSAPGTTPPKTRGDVPLPAEPTPKPPTKPAAKTASAPTTVPEVGKPIMYEGKQYMVIAIENGEVELKLIP